MNNFQEQFDERLQVVEALIPEALSEKGYKVLMPTALAAIAVAECVSHQMHPGYGAELAVGLGAFAYGSFIDRLSTIRMINQQVSLAKLGIKSPYRESNALVDTSSLGSFLMSRNALIIDGLLLTCTILSPLVGVGNAAARSVMAHNNFRKTKRLRLAEAGGPENEK